MSNKRAEVFMMKILFSIKIAPNIIKQQLYTIKQLIENISEYLNLEIKKNQNRNRRGENFKINVGGTKKKKRTRSSEM